MLGKEQNSIRNIINYLPVVACIILLSFSIFYINKIRDLWYVVLVASSIEYVYNKRWRDFLWDRKKIYYAVIFLFCSLYFIYYPFEEDVTYHSILLRNRIALLGLSVVGFFGLNARYHRLSVYLHTIVVTSLLVVLYIILLKIGLLEFITSQDKTTLFMEARIASVNSHMMFNLYLNISLISIWYIFSNVHHSISVFQKILYVFSYVLIFYVLSISEGRSGFLMSLFITGCIVFIEMYKRNKRFAVLCSVLFLGFGMLKIAFHPRVSGNVGAEPRIFLWENALGLINEKPVLGWGANDAQHQFTNRIWQDTTGTVQTFWHPTDFVDSHNQYIQTTMEFGVVGLLLLLFIYLAPFWLINRSQKVLYLLIFSVLMFQSVFDMFITGQFASLFMLITFMFLMTNNDWFMTKVGKSKK